MKLDFKSLLSIGFFILGNVICVAQSSNTGYWQQHVDYTMDIVMDVETYKYSGTQKLVYTNNSPDVLNRVFYHLYPNAFQPGSEMDARVQSIADPDRRMAPNVGTKEDPIYESRIAKLKPNEIGYIKVNSLTQNGKTVSFEVVGTILVVTLNEPIQPGSKTQFDMKFDAQVPVQIRRSGRNNKEGVALSMAQWYPKLAEYDTEGWHADPYIAREFHGVWGDFDVKITIDKNYTIGGTGYLQNPDEIGHGYETKPLKSSKGKTLTWHFKAPNVHDFTWAADPDYIHDKLQVDNGPMMHFFYKNTMPKEKIQNWKAMQPVAVKLMEYYSEHIGAYPYEQYSVIQGGDGGMEYGMCTLILGEGKLDGLIGVTAHEMAHSWFQFLLATNEAKHSWMDEGFTSYIEDKALHDINNLNKPNPFEKAYKSYNYLVASGKEQPQTTHSDRYVYNTAYSNAAYNKGSVFLSQLGYIIGEDHLETTLKRYFEEWSFKHPKPIDFIRIAEKVSGMELDWYLMDWTQTTNTIDYGIKSIESEGATTKVVLERIGLMPMPLDLEVEYTDGIKQAFYIPMRYMFGAKSTTATKLDDWAWAYPTYEFIIEKAKPFIKSVTIDPKGLMADVNRDNNSK
ncbi:M1 family metallopeptidase [Subsaxibacter sp. CAU 1640]|uniref:M1 family metallopeptidase n=1 Tax=Subsaxibacter sp. CAU 1640 TaxID=2933271 RepID=UPI002006BF37|nr:M1 family metallopeptidase [Subsaxibacter sp. CAU 1640]MCK7589481.1 M1 family metallopeptidase [Subsaxibacter sp. CAU 1640]